LFKSVAYLLSIPVFFLVSCNYVPPKDENSPYSEVPAGSILTLKREVVIPANRFVAYLDHATDLPDSLTDDEKETGCGLNMRRTHNQARTIKPSSFKVLQSKNDVEYTLRKPLQVAFGGVEMPNLERNSTTIFLQSEKYPEVLSVSCAFDSYFSKGYPLSVTVIRWALGGHFDIIIPKELPANGSR
jgi:hypothetical protein